MSDEKKRKLDELNKEDDELDSHLKRLKMEVDLMETKRSKLKTEIALLEQTTCFFDDECDRWIVSANGPLMHFLKDQDLYNVFRGVLNLQFSTDHFAPGTDNRPPLTFSHIDSFELEDKSVLKKDDWNDVDKDFILDFEECLKQADDYKEYFSKTNGDSDGIWREAVVPIDVVLFERIKEKEEEVEELDKDEEKENDEEEEEKEWVKELESVEKMQSM